MDALGVLADHVDHPTVLEPGIDHDRPAGLQPGDALAQRLDHAGAVRPEDPRLRHGGQPLSRPDVEVVQRRKPQPHEDLAGAGDRIGDVLVAQDLGAAVLMDDDRFHRTIV